jgi:hypothetical protein
MKSADDIRRLFKDAELNVHPETDEEVFEDVQRARRKIEDNLTTVPNRWRMTMKSPLAKLAVAAVVAIAVVLGLVMWTGTGPGIALADVLTRVEQVSAYMYQMTSRTTTQMGTGESRELEAHYTILTSQEHGMKMVVEVADPNGNMGMQQEMYMSPQQRTMIMIMPEQKKYMRMEYGDALFEQKQRESNDPRAMLTLVLACDYQSLGRSTIDGIEVEGFQTTDPTYLGGVLGQVDIKIWVDVNTQLPVQSEMDMGIDDTMQMHAVMYDFEWDVPVAAAEFEPVIPDDYTSFTKEPIKMPAMNEEAAIEGLSFCVELGDGRYPEDLGMDALISLAVKIPELEGLSDEEKKNLLSDQGTAQKFMDQMMPVMGLMGFHQMLVLEKKEPAYYGKTVTPEDADQVLMRWKVSENEYRVIFGSLHAETVTADVLAELEKTLPK